MRERAIKEKWPYIPSPPDERDFPLSSVLKVPEELPDRVMLEKYVPFVRDQLTAPWCVGFAGAGTMNLLENARGKMPPGGLSPAYLYTKCKERDGIPNTPGTYPRIALKIMQEGIPEEKAAPFPRRDELLTITRAMEDKATYKIKAYARLWDKEEIMQVLAAGQPVLIGTITTDKNWTVKAKETGFLGLPDGVMIGGHATFLIGYDKNLEHDDFGGFFRGVNSWGDDWGDDGLFWMPFEYADWESADLKGFKALQEAWAVVIDELPKPERSEGMVLRKGKIQHAVIHHSSKLARYTAEEVKKVHLARGFGDVGYNVLIEPDGRVVQGRDRKWRGAHTIIAGNDPQHYNENSLGYCLVWDGEGKSFPDVMYKSLARELERDGFKPEQIKLHREVSATLCPGKYFDKSKLLKYMNDTEGEKLPKIEGKAKVVFKGKNINGFIRSPGKTVADVTDICDLLGLKYQWNNTTKTMTIIE